MKETRPPNRGPLLSDSSEQEPRASPKESRAATRRAATRQRVARLLATLPNQ